MRFGVSRGRYLADIAQTTFQRTGKGVPVRAHLKRSTGIITITVAENLVDGTDDTITVGATAFTATDGSVTPGQATFDASGSDEDDVATSLAAQINAHATASTLVYAVVAGAVVTLYAKVEGAGTGHDVALSYEQLGSGVGATVTGLSTGKLTGGTNTVSSIAYIVRGQKMYINEVTGKADIAMAAFTRISDATYVETAKTGIAEDGSEVAAAIVDMVGGL
jgi:hypothetical protein